MIKYDNTEPDWNMLVAYGLPLNTRRPIAAICFSHEDVLMNMTLAVRWLYENRYGHDGRYLDSLKAALLVLKIHYPSEFRRIEESSGMDLSLSFSLGNVTGRLIKLRNIALELISRYYREIFREGDAG